MTDDQINAWADGANGPVALHLSQTLVPVEGPRGVIFPPTYAYEDAYTHYNIDRLSDGTRIATIDSVGSQANRMERVFLPSRGGEPENPCARLVPQIRITCGDGESVSLLQVGHRLGDALVRSTELGVAVREAFLAFGRADASPLARIGPTSLVFGAWDSRDTQAKVPRVVQSVIRANDVDELHSAAQYGPPVNYVALKVFTEAERTRSEGSRPSDLAQRGFVQIPSVNAHGGVIANGPIRRDVTVNLVALRRLDGGDGPALRRYILGLALVSATAPQDGFLRAGCLLTPDPEDEAVWHQVERTGARLAAELDEEVAFRYARAAADAFGVGEDREVSFDKDYARADAKTRRSA